MNLITSWSTSVRLRMATQPSAGDGIDSTPLPSVEVPLQEEKAPTTAAAAAAEPPRQGQQQPTAVSEAELYFLIANFLTHASPCSRAAAVLQEELVRRLFVISCVSVAHGGYQLPPPPVPMTLFHVTTVMFCTCFVFLAFCFCFYVFFF